MRVSSFSSFRIERWHTARLFFPDSIFQDHLVNNLAAVDASPTEEMLVGAIKFFEDHGTVTTRTVHLSLL
jgi:hypothetical protein